MRRLRWSKGQATVEFALVLPLLLVLLVGIVELGLFTSHLVVLRSGSYDLVRLASVGTDDSAVEARATAIAQQVVGAGASPSTWYESDPDTGKSVLVSQFEVGETSVVMRLSPAVADRVQGDAVKVNWAWHFRPIFVGWILGESDLTVSSTGLAEYPPPQ